MGFLDRLFNRKEEKKPETTKSVVTQETKRGYTGEKAEYIGDHQKRYRYYVNGVLLGTPSKHKDTQSPEYNRQIVLMKTAQEAIMAGDDAKLAQLTKRAKHEASLLKNPEFQALVEQAYTKAKETGLKYTDPGYQAAFNEVMVKAEEMTPNVAQRLSDVTEKMHRNDVKDTSSVVAEPAVQKTEMSAEQIMAVTKDNYQK